MTTDTPNNTTPTAQPTENSLLDSQARHADFAARVQALESAPGANAGANARAVQPDESMLQLLSNTAQHRGADGRPSMLTNGKFKGIVERLRADVLSGKPIDRAVAMKEIGEALGMKSPVQPAPVEPLEPQGTPKERELAAEQTRLDALADKIDAGEVLAVSELPESALSGYVLDLPEGFGIGREEIELLETARAANIPQSVVDEFVKARIAAGGR